MADKNQGEGNPEADRHYRKGVRRTVEQTTEEERAEAARDVDEKELEESRSAEEIGRERARH